MTSQPKVDLNHVSFTQALLDKYYAKRDVSHGIDHVLKVYQNTHEILSCEGIIDNRSVDICSMAALFHDAYDHKYVSEDDVFWVKQILHADLCKLKVDGFIDLEMSDIDIIIKIIDNVSFSHEKRLREQGNPVDLKEFQQLLNIVRDADRLEAIGEVAIERMIVYGKHNGECDTETLFRHIIQHCYEKLFTLCEDNYITTFSGRKMAKPLLDQLRVTVRDEEGLRRQCAL
jgi:uncharacterized protein